MARFSLIPKEEQFFKDFVELAVHVRKGSEALRAMLSAQPPAAELATTIKDLEHVCDKHTRGIIDRLNRTFVTPLDREDIHALDMREEATDRCEDMADPPVCLIGSRAVLTVPTACVTMSHMKEISLRELHRNTGAWVRSTRRYGAILVRDRNTAVATLTAVTEEPLVNVFEATGSRACLAGTTAAGT